jgi:hypothetical protein
MLEICAETYVSYHEGCQQFLSNLNKIGLCHQISVKLSNIKCHENLFSDSRIVSFVRMDRRSADMSESLKSRMYFKCTLSHPHCQYYLPHIFLKWPWVFYSPVVHIHPSGFVDENETILLFVPGEPNCYKSDTST